MHQPDPNLAQRRALGEDLVRHQMKAATAGFELEAVLVPHGSAPFDLEQGAGLFAVAGGRSKKPLAVLWITLIHSCRKLPSCG